MAVRRFGFRRIGIGMAALVAVLGGGLASGPALAELAPGSAQAGTVETARQPAAGGVSALSAGNVYACAINDGHLTCWGSDANTGRVANTPTSGQFTDVAAGLSGTCAIRFDGTLACWGAAALLNPPAGQFTSVSVSTPVSCAIRTDGTLACWGTASPLLDPPAGSFTAVAVGANAACAIDATDVVRCWGASVSINGDRAVAIESGSLDSFCAIRTDGSLICSTGFATPPANGPYTSLGVNGSSAACATRATGELDCWATTSGDKIVTDQPAGLFSTVSGHASGMCAMPSDGVPVCWGQDRITQGLAPYLVATCPTGQVGVPYLDSAAHYDSTAVVPWFDRFALTAGSLPPGLTMDPATGQFSGMPTQPGSFPVAVTARNFGSPTAIASCTVTVAPGVAAGITLTPPTATVKVGRPQAYSVQLVTATGVPVGDVTELATMDISAGAECVTDACSAKTPGTYLVTATYVPNGGGGPWTATAELIVEADAPPPTPPAPTPPDAGPTPSPPTPPDAGPAPSAGAVGDSPGRGDSSGTLARSGSTAWPLTLLAILALGAGGGIVVAMRRRGIRCR